jgi:hypothetical protein
MSVNSSAVFPAPSRPSSSTAFSGVRWQQSRQGSASATATQQPQMPAHDSRHDGQQQQHPGRWMPQAIALRNVAPISADAAAAAFARAQTGTPAALTGVDWRPRGGYTGVHPRGDGWRWRSSLARPPPRPPRAVSALAPPDPRRPRSDSDRLRRPRRVDSRSARPPLAPERAALAPQALRQRSAWVRRPPAPRPSALARPRRPPPHQARSGSDRRLRSPSRSARSQRRRGSAHPAQRRRSASAARPLPARRSGSAPPRQPLRRLHLGRLRDLAHRRRASAPRPLRTLSGTEGVAHVAHATRGARCSLRRLWPLAQVCALDEVLRAG